MRADGTIDDGRVLGGGTTPGAKLKVRFFRRGREGDAVCSIQSQPALPPAAWWYENRKAEARRTVKTGLLVGEPIDDVEAQVVVRGRAIRISPAEPEGPLVMLGRGAQPLILGCATDARGRRFAVLPTRRPLAPGAEVRGTPIEQVPHPGPAGARLSPVWRILQSLPILVTL